MDPATVPYEAVLHSPAVRVQAFLKFIFQLFNQSLITSGVQNNNIPGREKKSPVAHKENYCQGLSSTD